MRGNDWTLEKQMCQLGLGKGLTGHVALTGKPYLCPDTKIDPNYYPLFDNVRCELIVPIVVEERVWGLINLDGLEPDCFDDSTLSTVALLAELAAFAIKLRLDLTEQERLQRHLIQSEKLASLGETIAGIAHEINNPLTAILSNAQLLALRRGGPADEASINSIVLEAKRTADLVKNLLAFSRKESKKREVIGVNELIKQAVNLKRYQLKVNNIQLISEPCEISYPVLVTAQQMQQVLLNLLNNAEQAIAKTDHPGIIRVEGGRRGETVYITVTDNGVGIPAHVLPFIFDPFFTTKNLGEGTGLGLSIAHTLIENHGGTIPPRASRATPSSPSSCPWRAARRCRPSEGDAAAAGAPSSKHQAHGPRAGGRRRDGHRRRHLRISRPAKHHHRQGQRRRGGAATARASTVTTRSSATSGCRASTARTLRALRGDGPQLQEPLPLHERRSRARQHPGLRFFAQLPLPGQALRAAGALPESRAAAERRGQRYRGGNGTSAPPYPGGDLRPGRWSGRPCDWRGPGEY